MTIDYETINVRGKALTIVNEIMDTDPNADATNGSGDKYNDRKHGAVNPDMIIIHGTGCKDYQSAKDRLYDPNILASAHFLIKEDGTITRMVPEEKRAYHAGESRWKDLTSKTKDVTVPDINSRSIGIEISNRIEPGKAKRNEYTKEQIKALTSLCHYLQDKYDIKPENIIGHSDIAPARKQDPWENFPWKKIAKKGIGSWAKTKLSDHFNTLKTKKSPSEILKLLEKIGYKRWELPANKQTGKRQFITLKDDIKAFQLHYLPKQYSKTVGKGKKVKLTSKTVAKMKAVARQHNPCMPPHH